MHGRLKVVKTNINFNIKLKKKHKNIKEEKPETSEQDFFLKSMHLIKMTNK